MKGQYFSFDAIIGGVIFILTAMALFSYWYGISGTLDQRHDMLAKEAFRVSEMLYAPVDPGVAVGWRDQHINFSKLNEGHCQWAGTPQEAFGSGYGITIYFYQVMQDFSVNELENCRWGEDSPDSENAYRFRRTASYLYEDGNTTLGYVDILVYERILS